MPHRDARHDDMDDPVLVRGLLYFLCFCSFHLGQWCLDVLLTPAGSDALVRATAETASALLTSVPLLRWCTVGLLPFAASSMWRLADGARMAWVCATLCSIRMAVGMLRDDALVVRALKKRDLWPWAVSLVLLSRVTSGRKQVPPTWHAAAAAGARCTPWAVRIGVLAATCGLPRPVSFLAVGARDGPTTRGPLTAQISRCYDGDTCTASQVLWHGAELPPIMGRNLGIRVRGIDAPEIRHGRCELEHCLAARAQRMLEAFVTAQLADFQLERCVRDKYFRLTCDIVNGAGESAADVMLRSKLAVPYDGQAKVHSWCTDTSRAREHGCA